MPSFNKVILMGNITRDPELHIFASGSVLCELSVAMNRRYTTREGEQKEEVCFVGVKALGKTGENISKYFRKGDPILIEGRLSQDNWEDKETGAKKSKTYVFAERFEFIKSRGEESEPRATSPSPRTPPRTPPRQSSISLDDDTLDEQVPF